MKLIVMRHAKSSWDIPWSDDHDRTLAPRGRHAAALIGKWLADAGHAPDRVLCSTATRTRQTWQIVGESLPEPKQATFERRLYHAGSRQIREMIAASPADETVMVIGHNPGIGQFAEEIVYDAPPHPDFRRYPTAATLVVRLELKSWTDLRFRSGRFVDFAVPRDIR